MCPNSRYACLRSSPALVFYAEALLLLQYIFGLNLNKDELPIFSENVAQIGLIKYGDLSYQPLAIKVCYSLILHSDFSCIVKHIHLYPFIIFKFYKSSNE